MADLSGDIGGYTQSTTTPSPALFGDTSKGEPAVQGVADVPKTGVTWADIARMLQASKSPDTNTGGLSTGGTFSGYKQNVPVAAIQPIPVTDEKKSDQGLGEAMQWLAGVFGVGA